MPLVASVVFGCSTTSGTGEVPDIGGDGQVEGSDGAVDANDVQSADHASEDNVQGDEEVAAIDVPIGEDAPTQDDVEPEEDVPPTDDIDSADDVELDIEQDVGPECTPEGCDDQDPCTVDSCADDGLCVHMPSGSVACCKPSALYANFEADSPVEFELNNTDDAVGWQVIPAGAPLAMATTSGALYYGDPGNWNFSTEPVPNSGTAVSSAIMLPKGTNIELSFLAVLDIEAFEQADYFYVTVQDGVGSYQVFAKNLITPSKEWQTITVDLSAWAGASIRLGFSFDTFDEIQNDGFGILIDELTVTSSCAAPACVVEDDCVDGLAATDEVCTDGSCEYTIAEAGCSMDADCDDGNLCTTDSCDLSGAVAVCDNGPQLSCCTTDADCDDENLCTTNICDVATNTCDSAPEAGCCNVDLDCADGDKCTSDTCGANNACTNVNICCEAIADCGGQGSACENVACVAGACLTAQTGAEGCCVPFDYIESFEDGSADGWTLSPLSLAVGGEKFGWQVWKAPSAPGASASLYYGNPNLGNYGEGLQSEGTATTGPITLPASGAFSLTFDVFFGVELLPTYDTLEVYVDAGASAQPKLVWAKPELLESQKNTFATITIDVSEFAGLTIAVSFVFRTIDATVNQTLGILIDDVRVAASCTPTSCVLEDDCNDGNPLTAESCQSGKCFTGPALACTSALDCEDNNPCTSDFCGPDGICQNELQLGGCCQTASDCVGQAPSACAVGTCVVAVPDPELPFSPMFEKVCAYEPKAGCCLVDSECSDGNACTVDTCDVATNVCGHSNQCCTDDGTCSDADSCTIDACIAGQCLKADTNAAECCTPFSLSEDFNDGAANDWTLVNGSSSAGWSVWTTPAVGSSPALYYGSKTAQNFAPGKKTSGNAYTDFFTLPAGQGTQLSFHVYLDIDPDLDDFFEDSDTLTVLAVGDEMEDVVLWESNAATALKQQVAVQLNLNAFAGKTLRLQLRFQAIAAGNAGLGVLIDDVEIVSCQENACDKDSDCDDGDPKTTTVCTAGMCYQGPALPECEVDAECDDGVVCTVDVCNGGTCANPPKSFCCTADIDCADGETTCSTDLCIQGICHALPTGADGCCTPKLVAEGFDDEDLMGWVIDNDTVGIGWQVVTPPEAVWGSSVLYYGIPGEWNFDYTDAPTSGTVRSAPFAIPNADSSTTVAFKVYIDTEVSENFDIFEVRIIAGSEVSRVLTKAQLTQKGWTQIEGSLTPWAGKEVVFEFSFETMDNTVNNGLGVLIEDFEIKTTCAIRSCSLESGCDDDNGSTQEACISGTCAYGSSLPECGLDADCGDDDACSTDECIGGVCVNAGVPNCCTSDGDCDDEDLCTIDACDAPLAPPDAPALSGTCEFTPAPGMCIP